MNEAARFEALDFVVSSQEVSSEIDNSPVFDDMTTLLSCFDEINPLVWFHGRQVELDDEVTLSNNYIMFCCVQLHDKYEDDEEDVTFASLVPDDLTTICYELNIARDDFEMAVLVRMMDEEANCNDVYKPFLPRIPLWCLRVPFKERVRGLICHYRGHGDPTSFHCHLMNVKRGIMVQGNSRVFLLDSNRRIFGIFVYLVVMLIILFPRIV
ncbi:hypothetical protein BVRB_9g212810 [Beta vulgaris subsp. vulgaris]|nr:hypothetical protein BVRB_9g212810 [Beta vulgaris subsp. vulgaris]